MGLHGSPPPSEANEDLRVREEVLKRRFVFTAQIRGQPDRTAQQVAHPLSRHTASLSARQTSTEAPPRSRTRRCSSALDSSR